MTNRQDTAGDTPLMRQYREIKSRHPGAILFFRMGDFYEMFYEDAEVAARELGLTLTSRNNGGAANVPLAGVPVKAGTEYLRKLITNGHRVAICEQVEDPKLAKGVVRREVVQTVTPGAVLEDDWLERSRNNFLVGIAPGSEVGLAYMDLSTGEFYLEVVPPDDQAAVLRRLEPGELVLPRGEVVEGAESALITEREPWEFDAELAEEDLKQRFGLAGLEGLGIRATDRPALRAAAALLRYASELQPNGLPQLNRPAVIRSGDAMPLDEMTQRNLELVEPLRIGETETTLLKTLDRTSTPMGGRLLRQQILAPLTRVEPINLRLDAVEVLVHDQRGRERLIEGLDGVRDLERLSGRAATRRATPRDLGGLARSLGCLPDIKNALDGLKSREHSRLLEETAQELDLLSDLSQELDRFLVERPPPALGQGDTIKTGADRELDQARELRDGGKQYIASLQAREREKTGIGSLKVGYNKVFGYYLEVTKANRHLVPDDYERRQTLTNAERYVTPELKEYEARVLGAEDRILERERELTEQLSSLVTEAIDRIHRTSRQVAQLDVLGSLATVALAHEYVRPLVDEGFRLRLKQSRHPVVERMLPPGKFTPNDITLDDSGRVVVLTGPNMAGKSTALRQIGLAVVMAQSGSFVPAEEAELGVVDRVFTRVGASDNLGRGQSTFMVEMSETASILSGATSRSLILLDEIGRGTSTFDGVAIAWAVTEFLHERIGAKTVFATHYHELTQLTEELQHARNFNVAAREVGDDIVFLHRLEPGGADRSYGIHVARLAGLPPEVLARARELLKLLESGHHVAGQRLPPAEDQAQLPLFNLEHPVIESLRKLDPDNMTPLDALSVLAELKKKIDGQ